MRVTYVITNLFKYIVGIMNKYIEKITYNKILKKPFPSAGLGITNSRLGTI